MKYRLEWAEKAESQLAAMYLIAREMGHGREFTGSVDRIERMLSQSPTQVGESRSGNQRIIIEEEFVLEYEVILDDELVNVLAIRFTPPSASGR